MKKVMIWFVSVSCSVAAGFYLNKSLVYWERQHVAENVVPEEIAFLERYKSAVPCAELVSKIPGVYVETLDEAVIVWKMISPSEPIKKLVVGHSFVVAEDSIDNNCESEDA